MKLEYMVHDRTLAGTGRGREYNDFVVVHNLIVLKVIVKFPPQKYKIYPLVIPKTSNIHTSFQRHGTTLSKKIRELLIISPKIVIFAGIPEKRILSKCFLKLRNSFNNIDYGILQRNRSCEHQRDVCKGN